MSTSKTKHQVLTTLINAQINAKVFFGTLMQDRSGFSLTNMQERTNEQAIEYIASLPAEITFKVKKDDNVLLIAVV